MSLYNVFQLETFNNDNSSLRAFNLQTHLFIRSTVVQIIKNIDVIFSFFDVSSLFKSFLQILNLNDFCSTRIVSKKRKSNTNDSKFVKRNRKLKFESSLETQQNENIANDTNVAKRERKFKFKFSLEMQQNENITNDTKFAKRDRKLKLTFEIQQNKYLKNRKTTIQMLKTKNMKRNETFKKKKKRCHDDKKKRHQ
jgi:hypothetical protein